MNMKNLIKISVLALAATALMVSCQRETFVENAPEAKTVRTFTCTFAQPDSKVAITDAGKTTWEVGDEILVHGAGSDNKVTVTLKAEDISSDGKKATITVEGVEPYDRTDKGYTSTLYAQYPASLAGSGNFYYNARFTSSNAPLMAAADVEDTFVFYNLCGIVSFSVTGDFDKYVFVGNNNETVGYAPYQARVWAQSDGPHVEYLKSGDGATPVALLSVDGTLAASGSTLVCLPIGTNFTGGFTFKFYKNDALVKVATTKTAVEVKAGQILALGDITSKLEDYVAPSSHDATHPAIAGAEDLGSVETANCYIIDGSNAANAGKVFKFKAVRGNGTVAAGAISSVEILWETWNNAETVEAHSVVAEADFDKQDGNDDYWITFKMPATLHAGNALIAALGDSGDALWSWHIWVPSTAITSSTYGGVSTAPMMDRNLGALVIAEGDAETDIVVESCGMFYQWGRKDPFPGPKDLPNNYTSSATFSGTIGTRDATASTEINKYPNFFGQTGADTDGFKDWSTDHSSTLWGSAKNENDPCPPGWKLPIFASETGDLWDKDVTNKTGLAGYELNTTHHWLKLGVAYDAGSPSTTGYVYFPLAGYRTQDNSDYANAGKRALIWQAYGESGDYAKCLYSDGSFVGYRTERKGRGGNVRCVAE